MFLPEGMELLQVDVEQLSGAFGGDIPYLHTFIREGSFTEGLSSPKRGRVPSQKVPKKCVGVSGLTLVALDDL